MAIETREGSVVALSISTAASFPFTWKEMVCAEETSMSGTRETNKRKTKCGTSVSISEPEYVISGSGAAKKTPGVSEVSANELFDIFNSGAAIAVKVTDEDGYVRFGTGYMTSYNETANEGEDVAFDFQIDIQGELADTEPVS
jgi:hypothetical protein